MTNRDKKVFASNLHYHLTKKGITQKQLSKATNKPQSTISNWLTATTYPRIEAMRELADHLGVTIIDLVASQEEKKEIGYKANTNSIPLVDLDDKGTLVITKHFNLDASISADMAIISKHMFYGDILFIKQVKRILNNRLVVIHP